ncbi:MAG TPA: hypothetical protein VLC93_02495, partial [Myxococcota bacterium]|nr:hypothetical protein [Myxococcota bacterium]
MAVAVAFAATLAPSTVGLAQTCSTTTVSFTETFDNTSFRDEDDTSAAGWGQGTLKLSLKGNSFNTTGQNIGEKIFVVGAADFDNDGWTDMAAVMLDPDRIHFLK